MTYYIIGRKAPEGARGESQITHYKVATSLEDAKKGEGILFTREDFTSLVKDDDEILAYDPRDGRSWKLKLANTQEKDIEQEDDQAKV